nr:YlbF family regulator [uncultured Bacillus sp.]
MLATIERVVILENADQLAEMINHSEIADYYRICMNKMKNNEATQKKIHDFMEIKEKYEEVQRFGKYHPDYKKILKEVREVKRIMDLDEHVAEFRKAENDLQELLNEVSVIIGRAVSDQIKVPTGNPFFDNGTNCGNGGCGTGGGCGCSA